MGVIGLGFRLSCDGGSLVESDSDGHMTLETTFTCVNKVVDRN